MTRDPHWNPAAIMARLDARIKAAAPKPKPEIVREDRSFPEAADGRPMPRMGDELMSAGLDHEDARFVARMLGDQGYWLVRPEDIHWPAIDAFKAELAKGQALQEDAGGFWTRAIMTLFGKRPDPVETYRDAARSLLKSVHDGQL